MDLLFDGEKASYRKKQPVLLLLPGQRGLLFILMVNHGVPPCLTPLLFYGTAANRLAFCKHVVILQEKYVNKKMKYRRKT